MESDSDLFTEIKKQRRCNSDEVVTIDGKSDSDIPTAFATIYSSLFNRENDDANISNLMHKIH